MWQKITVVHLFTKEKDPVFNICMWQKHVNLKNYQFI